MPSLVTHRNTSAGRFYVCREPDISVRVVCHRVDDGRRSRSRSLSDGKRRMQPETSGAAALRLLRAFFNVHDQQAREAIISLAERHERDAKVAEIKRPRPSDGL